MTFAPVEDLIREIAAGRMVIMVDSEDRENEGDLILAAEKTTPEAIRFMAINARGLVCAPVAPEIADHLALPPMTGAPCDPTECAFTISVDARSGITTGISASDRAVTCQLLASDKTSPRDLKRPGHLFPLRARAGGVVERPGHTEAAVDLARLAGLSPAGVICEVMNDDGTMARLSDLEALAEEHNLLIGSIEDLVAYQKTHSPAATKAAPPAHVQHLSSARLPTPLGVFDIHVFENKREEEIVVVSLGDFKHQDAAASPSTQDGQDAAKTDAAALVRLHSACFTGDILGSLRCDCGGQLQMAMRRIGEEERGLLIYLPQEGRGIGLAKKIEAYMLQENGLDTVEANEALGFPPDPRSYEDAADVLRWFGVSAVRLMSNNPSKISGLEENGIRVEARLAIEAGPGPVNLNYLKTKKGKLGHFFEAV
ncbi:MAG: 3,4-dihydroxy-2-butanone-4-phosphate synthase [Planctomycetota bacterium]